MIILSSFLSLHQTGSVLGITALIIFVLAYVAVICEEYIHLRKSKPVMLAAGIIWAIVAVLVNTSADHDTAVQAMNFKISHTLVEFAELFLFLLVAMTYINAMASRNVFDSLRVWLVARGFTFRQIFWFTGLLSFFISPIVDNLTTALLMATVISSISEDKNFLTPAYINIVIASNAGGAFSPFGDITTLMVWQSGKVEFASFFRLFIPSLVNYLIPALIISFSLSSEKPQKIKHHVSMIRGARRICLLFLISLVISVCYKQFLHLPPFFGMMTGLSLLFFFGYYLKVTDIKRNGEEKGFNIFDKIKKAEWDTLLFFFGVIFCIGGLSFIGYLEIASTNIFSLGYSTANILAGILSAFVDNIPVMLSIISMNPEMGQSQWLLITLTAAVGGSLLSVGSAAGVAIMGQSKGMYSFAGHLKWSWCILLGYFGSIFTHFLLNS